MNVEPSAETQRLLEEVLESRDYASADDAIRAAMNAPREVEAPMLDESTLDAINRAEGQSNLREFHNLNDVWDHVRSKMLGC